MVNIFIFDIVGNIFVSPPPPPQQNVIFIELAKTEDALRPFVLACETKQVKLVTIAIGCIQKLISFHAIPEVSFFFLTGLMGYVSNTFIKYRLQLEQS